MKIYRGPKVTFERWGMSTFWEVTRDGLTINGVSLYRDHAERCAKFACLILRVFSWVQWQVIQRKAGRF